MIYADEAYSKVHEWLINSGIESESGKVLDAEGRCFISSNDGDECLIMLPPNQTILYFVSFLYAPDLPKDTDLLTHCLELNCIHMVSLETAAIGVDLENRTLLLKSAYKLSHSCDSEFDNWLQDFLNKTSQIKDKIETFFHSQNTSAESLRPEHSMNF